MRHIDLDPIGAMVELLASRFTRLDGSIDQLCALGYRDLRGVVLQRITARGMDRTGRNKHSGARYVPFVDGLLDTDVAVSGTFGLDVPNRRETLFQCAPGSDCGTRHPEGCRELQ